MRMQAEQMQWFHVEQSQELERRLSDIAVSQHEVMTSVMNRIEWKRRDLKGRTQISGLRIQRLARTPTSHPSLELHYRYRHPYTHIPYHSFITLKLKP